MFAKILIANRGEIACRIIRTARRMGIATVAVHSEADAGALHVEMADEAVPIGPAASVESYLSIPRILEACRRTGADAVHPGYGFLSENAAFARALEEAGIAFIGPGPAAIAAMGDKIESKRLAREAGVSTVPGTADAVADEATALDVAASIGFPVMIKASAGGGGKGMRIARSAAELKESLRAARSEARSSFGDDRVFIEKYVERPRHIEIQVLGDRHGNVVYLGERECSIQRRHQKVIEEAPSPFIDPATRAAMGQQAVALAKAVGYSSAGTVEFIAAPDRTFYFLEMNTRLQVEHPVTECVTGLDLVELMIRVAAGEKLPFTQDQVRLSGSAIEARIYAEDPLRGFLPSIGRLTRFRPPPAAEGLRLDTGVAEGGEITMHYDPMIAKLIAYGPDRDAAAARLATALDGFEIVGLAHNLAFLSAVVRRPAFLAGDLSTDFIAAEFPDGFDGRPRSDADVRRLVAVAALVHRRTVERDLAISGRLPGHRLVPGRDWMARIGQSNLALTIDPAEGGADVDDGAGTMAVRSAWQVGGTVWRGTVDGLAMTVRVRSVGTRYRLEHGGTHLDIALLTPRTAELAAVMPERSPADLSRYLMSPMPGLLVSLAVGEGQEVKAGQELAVVEAMKMENVLRAERDGVVARVHAAPGGSLAVDQIILEFA